jgi:hypothetical protein
MVRVGWRDWNNQVELIWLDYAGENIGELTLYMIGDRNLIRTLEREDQASTTYFGAAFRPYWETRLHDEQDARKLVVSVSQLVEYEGEGTLGIYLPNMDNQYDKVLDVTLANRSYPSTAVFDAQKIGKGTGIGIELNPSTLDTDPEDFPFF